MIKLDHLTVIAPTLKDGVSHVRDCLDLDVPFGTRHEFMGTHNHRLQLGKNVYLEIVSRDPDGVDPGRARWFGVDNAERVRADWEEGRRLRGWVASVKDIGAVVSAHPTIFGEAVALPFSDARFDFSIPKDGSLPLDGAAPSLICHRDDPTSMSEIPDLGARLRSFVMVHPEPAAIEALYRDLSIANPPGIVEGPALRYRARIETPTGLKDLT